MWYMLCIFWALFMLFLSIRSADYWEAKQHIKDPPKLNYAWLKLMHQREVDLIATEQWAALSYLHADMQIYLDSHDRMLRRIGH